MQKRKFIKICFLAENIYSSLGGYLEASKSEYLLEVSFTGYSPYSKVAFKRLRKYEEFIKTLCEIDGNSIVVDNCPPFAIVKNTLVFKDGEARKELKPFKRFIDSCLKPF